MRSAYSRDNLDEPGRSNGDRAALPVPGRATLTQPIQRDASAPVENPAHVHAAAARGTATGATALPYFDQIQRAFGRHDISGIQAHVGGEAAGSARAMGAMAYATGNHVVLGDGTDLHTVAHEAAHVVQQRRGIQLKGGLGEVGDVYERQADEAADCVVRGQSAEGVLGGFTGAVAQPGTAGAGIQRRLPSNLVQNDTDIVNNLPKLKKLLSFMQHGKQLNQDVLQAINSELAFKGIDGLSQPYPDKNLDAMIANDANGNGAWVTAIKTVVRKQPGALYSDPGSVNAPIQSQDHKNRLKAAYDAANELFDEVAAGTRDGWLTEVFGGSAAGAKARFANAKTHLALRYANIDTDLHGDDTQVGLGGYAMANLPLRPGKIHLAQSFFSGSLEVAKITLVHESAHLGNGDVVDKGYDGSPGYQVMQEADKLTNADHYAELMRRKLGASQYAGAFQPANLGGVGGPGVVPTHFENASRATSEDLRKAWTVGWRVLGGLRAVHAHGDVHLVAPGRAYTPVPGLGLQEYLAYKWIKFWSNVMGLTVHKRDTDVDRISLMDLALAEAVSRKLAMAMYGCGPQCATDDTGLTQLEKTDVAALKKRNIAKTLEHIKGIRSTPVRDIAMVEVMVTFHDQESSTDTMLSNKPAALPK